MNWVLFYKIGLELSYKEELPEFITLSVKSDVKVIAEC